MLDYNNGTPNNRIKRTRLQHAFYIQQSVRAAYPKR
jgi:hypothetical protein